MSDFIQGDNFDRPGGRAEEIVWNRIKDGLAKRELLGYSRYPLFFNTGKKRKEPDILLLDKENGIVIIEVKAFEINNILNIQPNLWTMEDYFERTCNPIAQAEDYLYALKGKMETERNLRGKIQGKYFVALPNISRSQWIQQGYDRKIDDMYILLSDDLTKQSLINKLKNQPSLIGGRKLDDQSYKIAQSVLGHETNYIVEIDESKKEGTKGEIYNKVRGKLYDLDLQQEVIAKSIVPGPQRIRGIAGSGKTVLLCQKAAIMHLRNPEWKIAVVFFTQSLYDNVVSTVDSFLRSFSEGEVSYDSSSNLKIYHAWGSQKKDGFYREVVRQNDGMFRNVKDVRQENKGKKLEYNNSINYISQQLLDECNGDLEEIFDAVLIDEGQDLIGDDEFKYEGKQSFYYMAYKSLKPIKGEESNLRRLVWAYDELQSLNDKKIPSSDEIFGDKHLVTGKYKGGANKSEVMKKCYRTPYQILTTAHAVGMGIFRKEGLISGYTRKDEWEKVGYEVISGDFRRVGSTINLYRPIENSPNPIDEFDSSSKVKLSIYNSKSDMLRELANNIVKDIEKEGLNPSRDILILNLYEKYGDDDIDMEIGRYLNEKDIDIYIPSQSTSNEYDCNWRYTKPEKFWHNGAVTISKIGRAKGNEAPMVYVVGLDEIAENEGDIKGRNKLFTAMTRSKCWLNLMGVGNYSLYEEIKMATDAKGTFVFDFSKPKKDTNDTVEEPNKFAYNI